MPNCNISRMSGCFLSLNKYLEQNKQNISNENSAPVTSNGLYTNQVSVNDLDCDVFSDIFLAPDSHFMKSTLQSNENDAGVACTVQSMIMTLYYIYFSKLLTVW